MPDINPITQMNHVDKILQKASESTQKLPQAQESIFAQVKGNTTVDNTVSQKEILNMLDVDTSNKTLFQAIKGLITSSIDLSNIKDSNDVSKINSQIEQTTSNLQAQVDMKMKAFYNEETSERKGLTEQEPINSFYNEETSEDTGYID